MLHRPHRKPASLHRAGVTTIFQQQPRLHPSQRSCQASTSSSSSSHLRGLTAGSLPVPAEPENKMVPIQSLQTATGKMKMMRFVSSPLLSTIAFPKAQRVKKKEKIQTSVQQWRINILRSQDPRLLSDYLRYDVCSNLTVFVINIQQYFYIIKAPLCTDKINHHTHYTYEI